MDNVLGRVIQEYWSKELPKTNNRDIEISLEKNFINDIVGPRRSGKTYLMYLTIKKILKKTDKKATIYINFENRKLLPIRETYFNDIIEFIYAENLIDKYKTVYLFLDEVQRIDKWEQYVRSIYDEFKDKIKIFVSGSSANLLSKEYSKLLTGRHLTTHVTPLSFKEFLDFNNIKIPTNNITEKEESIIKKQLKNYIKNGGFPDVVLGNEKDEIISQLFTDIVTRDVLSRIDVRKEDIVEEFSYYLASNVSNLLSFNKMKNYFTSRGMKISVPTLTNYFWHLKNAFLFNDSLIYSYTIKDQMQYPRKIYCIDNGIVNVVGFKLSENIGNLYENTVANELIRQGKKIYYWKNRQQEEVDFVVVHTAQVEQLIQVCYNIENIDTKNREIKSLIKAMRSFKLKEGLIITDDYDSVEIIDNEKIIFKPLWKWLIQN
jgi:uncharacterized protein